jgi:hypothetical protein
MAIQWTWEVAVPGTKRVRSREQEGGSKTPGPEQDQLILASGFSLGGVLKPLTFRQVPATQRLRLSFPRCPTSLPCVRTQHG